jgi:hypothetical protein
LQITNASFLRYSPVGWSAIEGGSKGEEEEESVLGSSIDHAGILFSKFGKSGNEFWFCREIAADEAAGFVAVDVLSSGFQCCGMDYGVSPFAQGSDP